MGRGGGARAPRLRRRTHCRADRRGDGALIAIDRRTLLGGAAAFFAVSAGAAPLRVIDDRVFVDVVVNGRATTAVLDSAAETSVLDRAFAARLGLRGGAPATAQGTGTATINATLVGGVTMAVAGVRLASARVAVIDLADLAQRLRLGSLDVIVGRDLFDAARLAVDLDGGTLVVVDRSRPPPGVRLPLTPLRGIEAMPCVIEGRRGWADFDLGNGGTLLVGAAFAARHRLLDGRATSSIPGGGIGGGTRQTTFTLRRFDLAGQRFDDVPCAIDTSPTAADANVGVRLLRRFGIVTDFAQRSVWLDWRR